MKDIRINPYVGEKYHEGWNGEKILILGESHYNEDHQKLNEITGDEIRRQMTNEAISDFVNNDNGFADWKNTYTCFERIVTNKELSQKEREDFWSRVVFYQFIQFVQETPRKPINNNQVEQSQNAFFEVLKMYMPDYIIVWGKRLYDFLPDLEGELETLTINGDSLPVWKYNIEGKIIPAMAINHPSVPKGKSREKWHPFINLFLNKGFKMEK